MRTIYFVVALLTTLALIIVLDSPMGSVPPLGRFISPQHGFWQNAEPVDKDFSSSVAFPYLKNAAEVYFDERLVPHVFAENENDAYFIQGYLHAKFRLWQMEFQTHAAAGRLSEILGPGPDSAYLNNDRNMRRVGMVYGAKRSLAEMENDPDTKAQVDAYTAGVNAYISNMSQSDLPLEYRLLNYYPEPWTNMKTALFLKYMSYDLTGFETDIEYTNAKSFFSEADFQKLYPAFQDSLDPIVPKGTVFPEASVHTIVPADADSVYFHRRDSLSVTTSRTDKDNGSNNWAVSGVKTRSGRPVLCNDPHLGLNLPSLWYEMQLSTPDRNVYGVSFPGSPAIIIGFNDSIAWGVTNAARDVRDYYAVEFKDRSRTQYRFNNQWKQTELHIDTFLIKGGNKFYDTVAYTIFGPVMYDDQYTGKGRAGNHTNIAVKWRAHDPSNELKTFTLLDAAHNYDDYEKAIAHFECPGQNFVFASKTGDIALWQQGLFPAKWKGQGDFIMPGTDSSYLWQADIPHEENPHLVNPPRGFVSSANQLPADAAYPYYLGGNYDLYRGLMINRYLSGMSDITIADMQKMQNDNYNVLAEMILPVLIDHVNVQALSNEQLRYLDIIRTWNRRNDNNEKGITAFSVWYDSLEQAVWNDELSRQHAPFMVPESYTLAEALLKDTAFSFIDNVNTPAKETLTDIVTAAFQKSVAALKGAEVNGRLEWSAFKDAGVRHLLRMEPLSRFHLNTGGGVNIINATKQFHGPSWRMIVQLTDTTNAVGVYPGGQSGNPGSRYYDDFVDQWAAGRYFPLWMMKKGEEANKQVRYTVHFSTE